MHWTRNPLASVIHTFSYLPTRNVLHHFSLLVQLSSFSFTVTVDKKGKNERTEYLLPPEGKEPLQDGN